MDSNPNKFGNLYLIPTQLGEVSYSSIFPESLRERIMNINNYIAENEKTARRFIKEYIPQKEQSQMQFSVLNKRTSPEEISNLLSACKTGKDMGLMSEAGCPGVADPGAKAVALAHQTGIRVIPMVGPSSILLAMMASGLNGQNFAFNGYLPIEKSKRKKAIKSYEKLSAEKQQAQIFIETPYRNEKLLAELKKTLHSTTRLCIARSITTMEELILTQSIAQWKKTKVDLYKKPTLFIFQY